MKISRIALSALSVLILASAANAASGLMVTNNSGLPIDELFVSAPGKAAFGANLMEGIKEGALDDGKSVAVAELPDGAYDFRISAPDEGVLCTISGVDVKAGAVEFTKDLGKACK